MICIQKTWLKPCLDFFIPGYESVRHYRNGKTGEGCATFITSDVQYQKVKLKSTLECIIVRVWGQHRWINIVNFYNPCIQINISELESVMGTGAPVIWVGDFNSHNLLWGSRIKDNNGSTIEECMDSWGLVCLNDGRSTRFDIRTGSVSCIDLALASSELARVGEFGQINHRK